MTILPRRINYWFDRSMKRIILFLFILCLFISCAQAASLKDVRYSSYANRIRVVFDLDGQVFYTLSTKEGSINIRLIDTEAALGIDSIYEIEDWIVKYLKVQKDGEDLLIDVQLSYPVHFEIIPMAEPSRLVIDFGRSFTKIGDVTNLAEGLDLFSIIMGRERGYVTASVLKADPKKIEVFPALAQDTSDYKKSFWDFFNPRSRVYKHFYKQPVSEIVEQNRALAGINGTYFASTGRPLGMLMIYKDLLTYPPVADRTALIISREGQAFVDQVLLDAHFRINGNRYVISGINEKRGSKDVVLYTTQYGELTGSDRFGFEITVERGKIVETRMGNSRIPEDGYVISAGALYAEHLLGNVKKGDKVKAEIKLIPYSSRTPEDIIHIIGGGPRLLKRGRIYVSKHEEKFRADIARGRAARTAVGITKAGNLLFVTVDGKPRKKYRKKTEGYSRGVSLKELAYLLSSLGATDALNLDGGSSSTMVIGSRVMNRPIIGSQRSVSNAILLKPRK